MNKEILQSIYNEAQSNSADLIISTNEVSSGGLASSRSGCVTLSSLKEWQDYNNNYSFSKTTDSVVFCDSYLKVEQTTLTYRQWSSSKREDTPSKESKRIYYIPYSSIIGAESVKETNLRKKS